MTAPSARRFALHLARTGILFLLAGSVAAAPRVWFVDNTKPAGDGSQNTPFASIGAATAVASAGDVILVLRGAGRYPESVTLREQQFLAGQGADLGTILNRRGIGVPPEMPPRSEPPVIDGGDGDALTAATGAGVAGFKLYSAAGRAFAATNASGEILVSDCVIETRGGTAVAIDGGDGAIDFLRSPIQTSTGRALDVRNRTGGAVRLHDGSPVTVSAGSKDAITVDSNRGTVSLSDPMRITTSAARGIVIRKSSGVALKAAESVVSTTGAAGVEISDSVVDIYLHTLSIDGGAGAVPTGVAVTNTSGSLRIDGGSIRNLGASPIRIEHSSGVTLQNLVIEKNGAGAKSSAGCATLAVVGELDCSASIRLVDATDIALTRIRISRNGQTAIFANRLGNLTIDGAVIEGAGDEAGEHGIVISGLTGHALVFDSTITRSASRQIFVVSRHGEGTLEIRRSRFDGGSSPNAQQAALVQAEGDAKLSVVVEDSDFVDQYSDGIHILASGSASVETFVNNSRFTSVNSAVNMVADADAQLRYRITGNTIRKARSAAINLKATFTNGQASGTIANNVIGEAGVPHSGATCGSCSGVSIDSTRGGSLDATIRENVIRRVDGFGIRVVARGTAVVLARVAGNTIAEPDGVEVLNAISMQAGVRSADASRLCVDLTANQIGPGWDPQGGGTAISAAARSSAKLEIASQSSVRPEVIARSLSDHNGGASVKATGNVSVTSSCF